MNKEELRKRFVNKPYGVIADGGFIFNRKSDDEKINGFTPFKRDGGELTQEQKTFNTHLSKMRVVVENTLAQVKQWRVLKGVYRHFNLNRKNTIDFNQVFFFPLIIEMSIGRYRSGCSYK